MSKAVKSSVHATSSAALASEPKIFSPESSPQAPTISKETRRYREVIPQLEKRDGRLVPFDFDKISAAIWKAIAAAEDGTQEDADLVAHQVVGERRWADFLSGGFAQRMFEFCTMNTAS